MLEYCCLLLISVLKTILLFSLLKGFDKREYPLVLIWALIIVCIILIFRNLAPATFITSFNTIMFILYLFSISLGAMLCYFYLGKITKLGYVFITYGIYGLLFCMMNVADSPLVIYGELVWIIGMWWMLTRRPIGINS